MAFVSDLSSSRSIREYPIDYLIFLGSGNSGITFPWRLKMEIPFSEIGLKKQNIHGHKDLIRLYEHRKKNVLVFFGRAHFYEGIGLDPYLVISNFIHSLEGEKRIINFCAVGALDPDLDVGQLCIMNSIASWKPGATGNFAYPIHGTLLKEYQSGSLITGFIGPTYGTPAESLFQRTYNYSLIGMSITYENFLFPPAYNIGVITDIAAGLKNRQGRSTYYHSHEAIVEAFQEKLGDVSKIAQRIIDLETGI